MIQFKESSQPQTLQAAVVFFSDPENAASYIAGIKWPTGDVCCQECGSVNVGKIASRARFQCREKGCRAQFSLTTGTIMEASHLNLGQWAIAVWMLVGCRNGASSCEIARTLGIKQQSAWHLLHRIRHIFTPEYIGQFKGVCEVDETFVGGLLKFMSHERRQRAIKCKRDGKTVVFAIKERASGKVRAEVIPAAKAEYVRDAIMENVEPGSMICTDESPIYGWADDGEFYHRKTVNHSRKQYVKGEAHVNGCEGFFNNLRRMTKGTYIRPTPEHLAAYVNEAAFRFNIRDLSEWERFNAAMRLIVGKRLTYSALTDGAVR